MTQPLTPPQIAEIKYLAGSCMYYGTDWANNTILSLIATLEARDAAFDEVLEALKKSTTALDDWLNVHAEDMCNADRVKEAKARIGYIGTIGYIANTTTLNRSAIAHAEKVK